MPDGTDISIYSRLAPGQCSVMGFDWENQEKLVRSMQWSKDPQVFSNLVRQIMKEFAVLGKASGLIIIYYWFEIIINRTITVQHTLC